MATLVLLLFSLLAQGWAAPEPLDVAESLHINNGVNIGIWGSVELCHAGSHAFGFEIKYEQVTMIGDDTAMNALKLYCKNNAGTDYGSISSLEGPYGNWQGQHICPQSSPYNYLTGVRAYVFQDQGPWYEDWGMEFVEMSCLDHTVLNGHPSNPLHQQSPVVKREVVNIEGREMEAVHINTTLIKEAPQVRGIWSEWILCNAANRVCGLQTRVDSNFRIKDTYGMTDLILFCCPFVI